MSPALTTLFALSLQLLFFVLTIIFVIFTIFTAYHWFTYGTSKSMSMLSLMVFLLGSAPLFVLMSAALRFI